MKIKVSSILKYSVYALFTLLFVVLSSSYSAIKAEGITEYDDVSYISYKATVIEKTDYDYVNVRDVTIEFNLPSSIDQTKMMVQFVISDVDSYTWDESNDYNDEFNDVGKKSFDIHLPYNENYIHSRMKLLGSDIIYILAIEYVKIDVDPPVVGEIKADGYAFGSWTNKDVTFTIGDATDQTSGIMSQTYRILKDNMTYTDWQSYVNSESEPFSITLTQTGVYAIQTKATDKANNKSESSIVYVKIDKETPSTGLLISSTTQYWNAVDVSVYIRVGGEDDFGRSGFSHYKIESVTMNNTNITTDYASVGEMYDGHELIFSDSGKYVIKIRGYDIATNYHEYVYEFGIDKIAQTISLTQTVTDKAVREAVIEINKGAFDNYSETKYYYLHGEFDVDTFVAENEVEGNSITVPLNGYYTFATIDEVGNIYVATISINNIITKLSVVYDGVLSQVVGDLSTIKFSAVIDVNASKNNIYWFVDGSIRQRGGDTFSYMPPASMGTYKIQARINSDTYLASEEFVITVSTTAATFIEIDCDSSKLVRTYGDESSIEMVAVVDEGASAESANWFINDEHFATGEAIDIAYDKIKNVGEYKVSVFIIGSVTYTDHVIIKVNPLDIVVSPIETTKLYGTEDPTISYTVSKLLYGDMLTGTLTREEGEEVGSYLISLGTLAHPNYNITINTEVYFKITSYDIDVIVTYHGYYNESTGSYKQLDKVIVPVGVNKEYTGEIKTFFGYHEYKDEAITIKVTDDVNTIDYYYTPIEYDVTINHISARDSNVILTSETKKVCIDQEVTVYTKSITGYTINETFVKFVMDGRTILYTIAYNPVDVNITVNHLGYQSKLLETETIQSWYGLTIQIAYKMYPGYSSPSDFYSYTISNEKINVVNMSYIPNRYDITIHHVDENHVKIKDDTTLQMQQFDSTVTLYPTFIDGYIPILEKATYTVASALFNEYTFVYRKAIKPVITLIGDDVVRINIDNVYTYMDQKANVNDYFSTNKQITGVWRGGVPSFNKIGEFYLDYNYINEDGLEADTVTRKIIIYDDVAPIITIGITDETIIVGTQYDYYSGINYSDNYDDAANIKINYETDLNVDLVGTYTIIYTVTDSSGNSATATRTVHVKNAKNAGGSFPIVPVIIGGVVGILGIVGVVMFVITKKKKENEGEKK